MKKFLSSVLVFFLIFRISFSQKEGLAAINSGDLKAYMTFFASDEMAGRETGTPENLAAALFIKSNLMRLNVQPVPGTGDYYQQISLVSTKIDRAESFLKILTDSGAEIMSTDSVVSLMPPARTMESKGSVVFAGYGYENKSTGYNDLEGIDIKGKILMIMTRNPEAVKAGTSKTPFDERVEGIKFASIFSRMPAAVLFVYDPESGLDDPYKSGMAELIKQNSIAPKGGQSMSLPFQILFITRTCADRLLKPTGLNLEQMQEKITKENKPVSLEIGGITALVKTSVATVDLNAPNVIGFIEGSDPGLKSEYIIYSAHFDHTGRNSGGQVNNGADDNASGSMALLEVAEAFQDLKKKPLRSIVFAWVNGEEKGLVGSRYYTENPLFPLDKTVVDINLDMVGRSRSAADTGKFYGMDLDVTGPGELEVYTAHESTELTNIMNSAATEAGIKLLDMGADSKFGGSDHASFRAKGIPAIFFNSGVHRDLHNTGDDVGKIDFDKMERAARLSFLIGYRVANQPKRITLDKKK